MATIPKHIWMLWLQGEEQLPPIGRICFQSWKQLNPSWKVHLLDEQSIENYLPLDEYPYLRNKHLPPQAKADIIRILLLKKYGGVWADISVYCARPLDEWADQVTPDGFFAFSKPREDKLFSNWFFISTPDNSFITIARDEMLSFWTKGPILPRQITRVYHKINHLLYPLHFDFLCKRYMQQIKYTGLYPYFWFHFLAQQLYDKNTDIQKVWNAVPHISSHIPQRLHTEGTLSCITEETKTFIQNQESPVHKLNWRISLPINAPTDTNIGFLMDVTNKRYVSQD